MLADSIEKALERSPIMKILAWMNLEAEVNARVVERIQNRPSATGKLSKAFFNQPFGSLGPGIQIWP